MCSKTLRFRRALGYASESDVRNALAEFMLQCVAVCCSVLQCVAVCCSVLQCVAVCCSVLLLMCTMRWRNSEYICKGQVEDVGDVQEI